MTEKTEKCVVCGKDTEYTQDIPINEREGYIEGGGQLCRACYYRLYVKSEKNDAT